MNINAMLAQRNMTKYRLSMESGVASATISDICSGKARVEKCSAETLYRIAKVLNVSIEDLIRDQMECATNEDRRSSFDVFKSNVCHRVKDMGDLDFIIATIQNDDIRRYERKKWYAESLYTLAMVDYLSRENGLPICRDYDDLRAKKLPKPVYPLSVTMADAITNTNSRAEISLRNAIPEFMRFNIVESEVRDVL